MSALPAVPAAPGGYWARHQTIVITWPAGMRGVAAIGRWRRNADGSVSCEYTRETLALALETMREVQR